MTKETTLTERIGHIRRINLGSEGNMTVSGTLVACSERWLLVGDNARDSLLIRGGLKPIAIRVSHTDSDELLALLNDANIGADYRALIRAEEFKSKDQQHRDRRAI